MDGAGNQAATISTPKRSVNFAGRTRGRSGGSRDRSYRGL
jgi:hypothetical protein